MARSQPLALTAAQLYTPLETIADAVLLLRDGRIEAVGPRAAVAIPPGAKTLDFGDNRLAPGLIDIHIHGGAGHEVMEAEPASLAAIETFLAGRGVTSYYPTTVTAPLDDILTSLDKLGRAIAARAESDAAVGPPRAQPLGIHLEGPFLSHLRRGVHPLEHLLAPTPVLLERFWQASHGQIRVVTIAPELPGAIETIAAACRHGIRCSLGHSDADLAATEAGIAAGASQCTHTFNAMPPLDHRAPNLLAAALGDERLMAELIADGIHVDRLVARTFFHAKGPERAMLVTDGISATGMPPGRYRLGPLMVDVSDGRCTYEGKLAGSVLTLDRAVRNAAEFAGWPLPWALRLATLNPARALGVEAQRGRLAAGALADIAVLTRTGEPVRTLVAGCVN